MCNLECMAIKATNEKGGNFLHIKTNFIEIQSTMMIKILRKILLMTNILFG